jgi:L-histidine N-alpha-methyltransferase
MIAPFLARCPPVVRVTGYRIVDRLDPDPAAERRELVAGLVASPARIAPKYFYDALGCALYAAICELPEYYPTRTERAIFAAHREDIARAIGRGVQFVDLGAGDCRKAEPWLAALMARRYVAVDFAAAALAAALARLAQTVPDVEMLGVVTDFNRGLDLAADLAELPTTFFYPGSSIGNFTPEEALAFLRAIHGHCTTPGSGLLIGADTKKAWARLDAAYDDSLGITAAFNRNVLNHVNRVLGSDFAPGAYAHRSFYNAEAGRVEMHLEAISPQTVAIDGAMRTFAAGERIHTENSYKYAPDEFVALLARAGFGTIRCWQDPHGDFAVFHAA